MEDFAQTGYGEKDVNKIANINKGNRRNTPIAPKNGNPADDGFFLMAVSVFLSVFVGINNLKFDIF
jgi:hypothetical protein